MAVFDATKRDNIRLRKDLERLEQEVDRLKQENNLATSEIKNHYHQLQNALARLATYEEENRAFQDTNAKLNVEVSQLKNQMKELTTNSAVKPTYTLASAAATDCFSEMTRLAQEAKLPALKTLLDRIAMVKTRTGISLIDHVDFGTI